MEMGVDCSVVDTLGAFESLAPDFFDCYCSNLHDCCYHPVFVAIPITLIVLIAPIGILDIVPPITIPLLLLIAPIALGSPLLLVGRIAPLALIVVRVLHLFILPIITIILESTTIIVKLIQTPLVLLTSLSSFVH